MAAAINHKKVTNWHALAMSFLLCLPQAQVLASDMWTGLFEEQLEAAEGGEVDAQYEVGIMYLKGQGVAQSRSKAVQWLKSASESGHTKAASKLRRMDGEEDKFKELQNTAASGTADAQYELATMYLKGHGTEQNTAAARKWLGKAAKQNHEKAITRLGILNYKGEDGSRDYAAALKLFNRVQQDSVLAQYYLGEMYASGKGVKTDYHTAIDWYKKAAQGGFSRARGKIINMEEELEMEKRREAKLAEAPEPKAAKPEKVQQQVKKKEVKSAPKQAKAKKAPAKKADKLSALEQLEAGHWKRGTKPVDYLPSRVTRCEDGKKGGLVCFSKVLQRTSGNKTIEYRVKSVIESSRDTLRIRYRNLVLDVIDLESDDEEEVLLGGYDDEVGGVEQAQQGYHVKTGWTQEHRVECKLKGAKVMNCVKDKTHMMKLVRSSRPSPSSQMASQGVEDY
jgi:TPR repeat protein